MSLDARSGRPPGRRTVIRAGGGPRWSRLAELWRYRDLLLLLATRDLKVRYKQTVLGVLWAVLQPLVTMVVLHIFFGRVLGVAQHVEGVAYPVFLFAGLVPWTLFATAVAASSESLVNEAGLLRKVYFPRLVMPIASVGAPLADYVLASIVLLGMMAWFAVSVTWQIALLPLVMASTLIAVLGIGVLLSALTVRYRDFRHVVPFLVQTLFFLTPVIYPVTMLPERWRWVLHLNPMSGPIEASRAAILGTPMDAVGWATSTIVGLGLLTLGVFCFTQTERRFADLV